MSARSASRLKDVGAGIWSARRILRMQWNISLNFNRLASLEVTAAAAHALCCRCYNFVWTVRAECVAPREMWPNAFWIETLTSRLSVGSPLKPQSGRCAEVDWVSVHPLAFGRHPENFDRIALLPYITNALLCSSSGCAVQEIRGLCCIFVFIFQPIFTDNAKKRAI